MVTYISCSTAQEAFDLTATVYEIGSLEVVQVGGALVRGAKDARPRYAVLRYDAKQHRYERKGCAGPLHYVLHGLTQLFASEDAAMAEADRLAK